MKVSALLDIENETHKEEEEAKGKGRQWNFCPRKVPSTK